MGASEEEERSDFAKVGNVTVGSVEARQGTDREHSLSLSEAVRLYPTAVGWSIYFSLGVSGWLLAGVWIFLLEPS